jgi:Zn-dependent protease with chaperone function
MNFFQRQDEVRRASRRLVFMFVLAVLAVICAVDAVVVAILWNMQPSTTGVVESLPQWLATNSGTVLGVSIVVLGIIGLASLYKTVVLSGGGGVVARSLGGVRISNDTTDAAERRLLNVVEEMSIASGVPMPEVYLLEQEAGINAFAAGHNPANAAIGVTRGAITTLNRAELQGVIGHEFSHILNGDMRLNVRLMGLLFGLLVIALIARTVLRVAPHGRDRKGAGGAIALAAVAVLIIGYVGLFFGRLIQAAVSRRREALADASAVQFTRDPTGLRNALVKIGAAASGSKIANPDVDEVAHMLFAPGMSRLFATHPPLIERLKAIDPHFDPAEIERVRAQVAASAESVSAKKAPDTRASLDSLIGLPGLAASSGIAEMVGNPATEHMDAARGIRESLSESIVSAGRHANSARALLLALALDEDGGARERQKRFIAQQLDADVLLRVAELEQEVDALQPAQRMPALFRAFPALRQLPREERMRLMSCLNGMLQREGKLSLHSYVLRKLAQVQLRDALEPSARQRQLPLSAVQNDVQVLFSVLAQHGHHTETESRRAYEAGMHHIYPRQRPAFAAPGQWNAALDIALSRLDQLAPVAKEQLVEAMLKTVTHDQKLTISEAELLRVVCASLHCPLPPLIGSG